MKAKDWYAKILSTDPVVDQPAFVSLSVGNDRLGLNLVDQMPKDNRAPSVAYWAVSDIKAEHQRLIDNGALAQGELPIGGMNEAGLVVDGLD